MNTQNTALLTPRLRLFMGTMVLANIAGAMHRPLLPLYLQELGANVGQVGIFFTLGALAPLAFKIFGGWLSDSIGRLQAIAIGSVAGVMGYVVFILAPSWQWLLIAMVTGAMTASFVAPSFQAFIAEESTEETRGRVYGLSQSLFMVVGLIGPPIGGYWAQYFSFKAMYSVSGGLYTTATGIRLLMASAAQKQNDVKREKPSLNDLKVNLKSLGGLLVAGGVITWIFISDGILDTTFEMISRLMPLYLQNLAGLSKIDIGVLSSIQALSAMLLMVPSGWLSDKKGERVGIATGFFCIAVALAVFLNSQHFAGFAVAWVFVGIGIALVDPAYSALISKVVPARLRGTAFGLFSTSIGLISLPSPYIGAMLWERVSPKTPFYVPIVAILLVLPLIWVKFTLPTTK